MAVTKSSAQDAVKRAEACRRSGLVKRPNPRGHDVGVLEVDSGCRAGDLREVRDARHGQRGRPGQGHRLGVEPSGGIQAGRRRVGDGDQACADLTLRVHRRRVGVGQDEVGLEEVVARRQEQADDELLSTVKLPDGLKPVYVSEGPGGPGGPAGPIRPCMAASVAGAICDAVTAPAAILADVTAELAILPDVTDPLTRVDAPIPVPPRATMSAAIATTFPGVRCRLSPVFISASPSDR